MLFPTIEFALFFAVTLLIALAPVSLPVGLFWDRLLVA